MLFSKSSETKGVSFNLGTITFNDDEFSVKLVSKIKSESGISSMLESVMNIYNLQVSSPCGKTLVEYHKSSYKYPFVFKDIDGKLYKCNVQQAKMYFTKKEN
jgi:hypothetical protein